MARSADFVKSGGTVELKVLELPTDSEAGIDLVALERAFERKSVVACLLSSSFNDPLGCTMPDGKKRHDKCRSAAAR